MARQAHDHEHDASRDENVHGHAMPWIPLAHLPFFFIVFSFITFLYLFATFVLFYVFFKLFLHFHFLFF